MNTDLEKIFASINKTIAELRDVSRDYGYDIVHITPHHYQLVPRHKKDSQASINTKTDRDCSHDGTDVCWKCVRNTAQVSEEANKIACHLVGNNDISLDEARAYCESVIGPLKSRIAELEY